MRAFEVFKSHLRQFIPAAAARGGFLFQFRNHLVLPMLRQSPEPIQILAQADERPQGIGPPQEDRLGIGAFLANGHVAQDRRAHGQHDIAQAGAQVKQPLAFRLQGTAFPRQFRLRSLPQPIGQRLLLRQAAAQRLAQPLGKLQSKPWVRGELIVAQQDLGQVLGAAPANVRIVIIELLQVLFRAPGTSCPPADQESETQ